ncbi:MAG: hypothetical protein DRN78_01275 [Thermoproteota archaeon]|nr:MAG: hypothetical protein DRN78_01275 [Candidatus Korarchaeota archaeon]
MRRKYRSQAAIIADMLEAISRNPGIAPTRLGQKANVPYSRLTQYLKILEEKNLVTVEDGGLYITENGLRFLNEVRRLKSLFSSLGLVL